MKTPKLFVFIITLAFFSGCKVSTTVVPLKGAYLEKPYEITTDKPLDQVWSNIIDFFATKGLPIKLIDKSSGLIISEKTKFSHTYEKEDGTLENPVAYVVLNEVKIKDGLASYSSKQVRTTFVTGEWNIRIKTTESGKTMVNINITGLEYDGKSTGIFEKLITAKITE